MPFYGFIQLFYTGNPSCCFLRLGQADIFNAHTEKRNLQYALPEGILIGLLKK